MRKEIYTTPVIEVIEIELSDVMTASFTFDNDGILDGDADSWWD